MPTDMVLGRMTVDEIHEIWPITGDVPEDRDHPDFMPDHVLDRLLREMRKATAAWHECHVPVSTLGRELHERLIAADLRLGLTPPPDWEDQLA